MMIVLVGGVVLFIALHGLVVMPAWKQKLKERLGKRRYGAVFGLLSVLSLMVIIWGWQLSPFVPVYEPKVWARHVNYVLMLLAFICLGIFLFKGSWRQRLRFPLGFATLLWATGHLFANGDLAGIILFGGMFFGMLVLILMGIRNNVWPSDVVKPWDNVLSLMAGIAMYGGMILLHYPLIGLPIY